ncbi:MAG TPA: hypothetical protein VE954_11520 [Oligoflexus sp.]|nr:hypothetical protein [Oligoflexus sp.]
MPLADPHFPIEALKSATTEPKREPKHSGSGLAHHARQPYGLLILGGILFVAAWWFWTFFMGTPV